jgi:titin
MSHKKWTIPSIVLVTLVLLAVVTVQADPPAAPAIPGAPAATHTVDSTGDGSDANPGDGVCETAAGNGVCTLRAAIEEANALTGPDTIYFEDSVGVIMPYSSLPALNDTSGGTTIKGNPTWLLGSFAGASASGLELESDDNKLQGLYITNFTVYGVAVMGNNNIIGADGDGVDDDTEGNVISSNGLYGVVIHGDVTENWLAGNWIGLTFDGQDDAGNTLSGVRIESGAHTNLIGTDGDGTSDELERNVISGNDKGGVSIVGAGVDQNTVAGNYIGTNAAGDAAVPNKSGVIVSGGAANNLIGTDGDGISDELERNVIAGNLESGVSVYNSYSCVVAGNYIGTNATGDAAIPNGVAGVLLDNSQDNVVGTNGDGQGDAVERNVISGNGSQGVLIRDSNENTVAGNYIGTNAAGDAAIPNDGSGVLIKNSPSNDNLIGTDADGISDDLERNLISGNGQDGVSIRDSNENTVAGNYIGANATGGAAIPNGDAGVEIDAGANNRVGGTMAAERNVISGNGGDGVIMISTATLNLVQGNYIGTDASGDNALGNEEHGVHLRYGPVGNTVGGTTSGAANRIAFNGLVGIRVAVYTTPSYDNSLRRNAVFSNGELGIDLDSDGVTPNDVGDGDTGSNHLQNFPVLSSATSNGSQIIIGGALNSSSNTTFALDFYANSSCDPSGYGEGEIYLGANTVTTDGSGDASFTATLLGSVPEGYYATATATDPDGNTSEFSACSIIETWVIYLPLVLR